MGRGGAGREQERRHDIHGIAQTPAVGAGMLKLAREAQILSRISGSSQPASTILRRAGLRGARARRRYRPGVGTPLRRAMSSGVPWATMRPPASPPSGPRSMTQSAALITSRLCSMTSRLPPFSIRRWKAASSLAMSSKCRPVVGSSKMKSVPAQLAMRQVRGQLHALRFAAGERGGGLAQPQIAQAHVVQHLQACAPGAARRGRTPWPRARSVAGPRGC